MGSPAIELVAPKGGVLFRQPIAAFFPELHYALRWEEGPQFRTSTFVMAATPSLRCRFYLAGRFAYAQFNRGTSRGARCVRTPACRYTSQIVGVCCRSTIRTVPSLDFARRCVSSRAPLKNVKGADRVNCDWPPCCSTHCSRVPRKHCQSLRLRYTILLSPLARASWPARDSNVGIQVPP